MSLGMDVGLGPGDIVLRGPSLSPQRGYSSVSSPHFSAYVCRFWRQCTDCAQKLTMTSSSCLPFTVQDGKGAARSLRAYIAVSPQIHCIPSSYY